MNNRARGTTLSLENLLKSFPVQFPPDGMIMHNSGNDAFWCLWALQMMMEGVEGTKVPTTVISLRKRGRKKSGGLMAPMPVMMGGMMGGTSTSVRFLVRSGLPI